MDLSEIKLKHSVISVRDILQCITFTRSPMVISESSLRCLPMAISDYFRDICGFFYSNGGPFFFLKQKHTKWIQSTIFMIVKVTFSTIFPELPRNVREGSVAPNLHNASEHLTGHSNYPVSRAVLRFPKQFKYTDFYWTS